MRVVALGVLAAAVGPAAAIDNGIGLTPPMGWRSWNCFHGAVNQSQIQAVMDKMSERTRTVGGKATSFLDLGFSSVGLDDNWQACGAGWNKSFHTESGEPMINFDRFPDMKAMVDYGHSKGLKVGWYMNNCICAEHQFSSPEFIKAHMEKSAAAVAWYGFDGVKLDGCGQFLNLTWWAELLNATGRPIEIENCHWGRTVPGSGLSNEAEDVWHQGKLRSGGGPSQGDAPCSGTTTPSDCPYNFFRSSGDITNTFDSMHNNLQTTKKFQGDPPLSRPGTWAYPDMLEVGNLASFNEDRTHFGAWCIVSSPLILGHNLLDESLNDRVWPILSNTDAIAVNQAWAGHPGRQVSQVAGDVEVWAKPLPGGKLAVLMLNPQGNTISAAINLSEVGWNATQAYTRDLWTQSQATVHTSLSAKLDTHDSAFWVLCHAAPCTVV
eukprot:Hpha_TRINITY_DN15497_c2_g9::TRINITY_DN15497_c2_g9_i1::g.176301::m.176301/K07407/E3.2.1.22B, galA, rafA; alpha-galactosidase